MKQTTRNRKATAHRDRGADGKGTSKYAAKVARGDQMYGGTGKNSCCANRIALAVLFVGFRHGGD